MPLARLVAVFFFLCCATAAHADAVDDALAKFLDNKFSSTEQGVNALAATGAANAPAILSALGDNRLLIDPVAHIIVYQTTGGELINAKTSEKLSGVDVESFKKVRVNNGLRSAIAAAVGALTLASPDPQMRASAAEAVFKSRDAGALAALDEQLSRERNPHVRHATMVEATCPPGITTRSRYSTFEPRSGKLEREITVSVAFNPTPTTSTWGKTVIRIL